MNIAQTQNALAWSLESALHYFFDHGFSDGELISHEWIRFALAITPESLRENDFLLLDRMETFKAALLSNHQIALQNVRGKGYRIVPPGEQARFAAEEASRFLSKGIKRADELLANTRREQLDKDEARRHTDVEVRMAGLRGMVGKGQRDVFALFAPK